MEYTNRLQEFTKKNRGCLNLSSGLLETAGGCLNLSSGLLEPEEVVE